MRQYLELIDHVISNGTKKEDRTGTGTLSVFGYQMRFDLNKGFPLVTTKKIHTKSVIHELLWMLRGYTNIKDLNDNGVHIWDSWANEFGELGPVYGAQWRSWWGGSFESETHDQIETIINQIKETPDDRGMIVSAWNVSELDDMALRPCHTLFQFYVNNGKLSLQLYQRSADVFLGVPFNIASYALLTHMIAQVTGLEVGEFVHTFGDAHIYLNHIEQCKLQLTRDPKPLPNLVLNPEIKEIDSFTYDDIKIENYEYHPHIKGKVAV